MAGERGDDDVGDRDEARTERRHGRDGEHRRGRRRDRDGRSAITRRTGAVALAVAVIASGCSGDDDTPRGGVTWSGPDSSASLPAPTGTTVPATAPAATTLAATSTSTSTSTAPTSSAASASSEAPAGPDTGDITVAALGDAGNGRPQTAAPLDLAARGYVEEEFVLSGQAVSYTPVGAFAPDGRWDVTEASTAPYTTRLLVRRPAAAADFNGVVLVEWLNVSSQVDLDAHFAYVAEEVLRGGYAWVGVSAQAAGIDSADGSGDLGAGALGLSAWDPARYSGLTHPGDAFSYAIFSDAGAVLRRPGAVDPLGGLQPQAVLAVGESQSAFRLVTYVNAVLPRDHGVYDGVLIHSRDGAAAPLGDGYAGDEIPQPVHVRHDLDVPVLQLQSETDLYDIWAGDPGRSFPPARQPDTDRLRTWEVAGTSHSDRRFLEYLGAQGSAQFDDFADLSGILPMVNDGPHAFVARAALRALRDWVLDGTVPPVGEPIEVAAGTIVRDDLGLAVGGVRTPTVDVPVEVNTGAGLPLAGSRADLDPAVVAARYPTPDAYVAAVTASLDAVIAAGFVLPDDRAEMLDVAIGKYPAG